MCIRDRLEIVAVSSIVTIILVVAISLIYRDYWVRPEQCPCCLLYTSDAADERSSVDLGGRRIIKKKKKLVRFEC